MLCRMARWWQVSQVDCPVPYRVHGLWWRWCSSPQLPIPLKFRNFIAVVCLVFEVASTKRKELPNLNSKNHKKMLLFITSIPDGQCQYGKFTRFSLDLRFADLFPVLTCVWNQWCKLLSFSLHNLVLGTKWVHIYEAGPEGRSWLCESIGVFVRCIPRPRPVSVLVHGWKYPLSVQQDIMIRVRKWKVDLAGILHTTFEWAIYSSGDWNILLLGNQVEIALQKFSWVWNTHSYTAFLNC